MIELVDIGMQLLETYLNTMKSKLPVQVVTAIQASIDALAAHKNDLITKAELEAQRG